MHILTHVPTYPRTHAPTHPRTHAHTHPRTHAHTHTHKHAHTHTHTHTHTCTYTHARTYAYTHTDASYSARSLSLYTRLHRTTPSTHLDIYVIQDGRKEEGKIVVFLQRSDVCFVGLPIRAVTQQPPSFPSNHNLPTQANT